MTATVSAPSVLPAHEPEWVRVCSLSSLDPERGVAALIDGRQIAIFRTHGDELFATDNRDPFSGAMVMSRGIVGTRGSTPTVASPMYKQVFDLRTGRCFDDPDVSIGTHPVRVLDDSVEIGVDASSGGVVGRAGVTSHTADDSSVRGS